MDHTEAIVEIKNAINEKFIEIILPFIKHRAKKHGLTRAGLNKDVRNVNTYQLLLDSPTDTFYWNFVKKEVQRLYVFYKSKFPIMSSNKVNQIDLLKYTPGGKYEIHTDHYSTSPRHLSVIMNLNDEYEGGDLIFTDQKYKEIKRLKLGKGSIVFFPSNFMYPHGIESIKKGTRYSIVVWLQ